MGDPATPSLTRLPWAATEARSVESRLRAAYPEMPTRLFLDTDATPTNYLSHARGAGFVHLACHAIVGDSAEGSALYLATDQTGDDRLDLVQISQAPLNDALVFLSACRSGTGRAAAEGTVGLAREFLRAGARTVVASHWDLPDEVTATLVDHVYSSFIGDRRDIATSVKEGMLATRAELERKGRAPHPGAWGPFFVLGDGTLRDDSYRRG